MKHFFYRALDFSTYFLSVKGFFFDLYQKVRWGVSYRECWNLDVYLADLILKRLKRFKTMKRNGYPDKLSEEEWEVILDKMIWSFERSKNIFKENIDMEDQKAYVEFRRKHQEGLDLFAKYFSNLWD